MSNENELIEISEKQFLYAIHKAMQEAYFQYMEVLRMANDVDFYLSNGYRVKFYFNRRTGQISYSVNMKEGFGFINTESVNKDAQV